MPVHAHIHHGQIPPSPEELARARWEDDGGPLHLSHARRRAEQWERISAALTHRLPDLADRHDVRVTCQPGTRSGAPGAFFPTMAELELDAELFKPLAPSTIDPMRHGDEERYPATWGVFVHEAAHAAHSAWTPPLHLRGTAVEHAADLLEESRAEHAHLARRPGDRRFLRAAAHHLILPEIAANAPADRWQAAHAAGLILARRDAGILDPGETTQLERLTHAILGSQLLGTLAKIWREAHATGDTDGTAMLDHARAWCQALGVEAGQPAPAPGTVGEIPGLDGALANAVNDVTTGVAAQEAQSATQAAGSQQQTQAELEAQEADQAARDARVQARKNEAAHARAAAKLAKEVFSPKPSGDRGTPVSGSRAPTKAEKTGAGQLARALRTAAHRERTTTQTSSTAPPGRLNMRAALAREAQRAAGATTPTAQPWRRTQHRHTSNPPLRIGIAVDVSASMKSATGPIASAAWILAKATALSDPESRSATVAFDEALTAITAPGKTPTSVTRFRAGGLGHNLGEALDALSAGLELTRPGTGRLAVIASDGRYRRQEVHAAAQRLTTLRKSGCALLWLAFAPGARPPSGVPFLELTDPTQAVPAIAHAATQALRTTRT